MHSNPERGPYEPYNSTPLPTPHTENPGLLFISVLLVLGAIYVVLSLVPWPVVVGALLVTLTAMAATGGQIIRAFVSWLTDDGDDAEIARRATTSRPTLTYFPEDKP
jgi:divalent metal cation (Fe/Co/Zn/Cd) transporter